MLFHLYSCALPDDHKGKCRTEGETWEDITEDFIYCYQVYKGEIQSSGPIGKNEVEMPETVTSQIGGTHYTDMAIQPWEIIERAGLDFWEGNVIKYLMRYRTKNGLEDLMKAMHYLEYIIQREAAKGE